MPETLPWPESAPADNVPDMTDMPHAPPPLPLFPADEMLQMDSNDIEALVTYCRQAEAEQLHAAKLEQLNAAEYDRQNDPTSA